MSTLTDWQFELGGVVLGQGTRYFVASFEHGKPDTRDQDADLPLTDGMRFGKDFLGGATYSFEIEVEGSSEAAVLDNLGTLRKAWQGDPARLRIGDVVALRYKRPGQPAKRVYGRPRRFTPASLDEVHVGFVPVTCDFRAVDHRLYDDAGSLLTFASVAQQYRTIENLVTNPSLEVDVTGWSAGSFTAISRSTSVAWVGSASLEMIQDGAESTLRATYSDFGVSARADYTAQARFFSAGSHLCQLEIEWFDSAAASLGIDTSAGVTNTAGSWTRESLTATAPSGAATATLTLIVTDSAGDTYNADAVMVTEDNQLLNYGDGDQPGWFWTGTAHASTSKRVSGGIVWPIIWPAHWAEVVEATDTVVNTGNELAWPVFTFHGPGERPSVNYLHQSKRLELALNLGRGDTVVVDTRPWARTATRGEANVSGALRGPMLADLGLEPGETTLDYDSGDQTGAASLTVEWASATAHL